MASTGVISPETMIEGMMIIKEVTKDCILVLDRQEIAMASPTMARENKLIAVSRLTKEPTKGISK